MATGLDWQTLSVSLAQGIDTKTDPKQVQTEYLLLQNTIYKTVEQLRLRDGFTNLSTTTYTGGSISAGNSLGGVGNSLLEYDGSSVYSRTTDLTLWSLVGQKTSVTSLLDGVGLNTSPYISSLNMAKAPNGLELYVWVDRQFTVSSIAAKIKGTAYYSVFDPVNGMLVTSGNLTTPLSIVGSIRALVVGTDFFIVSADGANIKILKQPQATPNFSSASATTVSASAIEQIDCTQSTTDIYILADKVYKVVASSLAVTSTAATGYGIAPSSSVAWDSTNSILWAIKELSTTNTAVVFNSSLTVLAGPTTISTAGFFTDVTLGPAGANVFTGTCYFVGQRQVNAMVAFSLTYAAGVISHSHAFLNTDGQVYSKPIVRADGYVYLVSAYMSYGVWNTTTPPAIMLDPLQPTSFLFKFQITNGATTTPSVVSRFLPLDTGISYGPQVVAGPLYNQVFWTPAQIIFPSDSSFIFPNLKTTTTVRSALFTAQLVPTASPVRSSFNFGTKMRTSSLAFNSQTTGGYLSGYDGSIEVENNFNLFPELTFVNLSGSTGLADGTYSYRAVYSWIDAQGQLNRSSPSDPLTVVVTGGPKNVNLTVSDLNFSDKSVVRVDVYRTAPGGTIYFYVFSFNPGDSIIDVYTVSTLELYTTGGEVDNIAPPATEYITSFKNRLWMIPSEDQFSLWYSKQVIAGFPVEFSDLFTYALDQREGKAKAIAPMDDKLIIFKQTGIFYMVGDGPAPSGANNDFSYPQFIPSDCGVIEPDSVVGFPEGVFFKGSKGIYLLTRSLQVTFIGAPVEAYNSFTVTASDIDYNQQIVRFCISNGTQLVYDYYNKKWSVFTNISAVASKIVNGVYYYLKSTGVVEQETPGTYSDNGSVISMGLISGWLSLAKITGFQRIRIVQLLGKVVSPCTLAVSFAYNFDPTIVQTATIVNTAAEDPWDWQIYPNKQKCSALQLTMTVTPTVVGAALSLSVIGLEAGIKKGLNPNAANRSTS